MFFSSWSRDCEMHSRFNKILTMIDKLFLSPLLNNSRVYERTERRASSLPCGQTRRLKSISKFWKSWKCVSNKKLQRHSISHRKGSVGMRAVGVTCRRIKVRTIFASGKLHVTKAKIHENSWICLHKMVKSQMHRPESCAPNIHFTVYSFTKKSL